jgi:hypothetical protein
MKRSLKVAAFLAFSLAVSATAARVQTTPTQPTFFARRDYPGGAAPLQVADTNGDGIPDLIQESDGYVSVLFGNGDGTFRQGPNMDTVIFDSSAFAATDLNGDGIADLVLVGGKEFGPGGIAICMGNGDGTFSPGTFYPAGSANGMEGLALGDFNGDGIPDVVAVGNGGVWLFAGQGGGSFNPGVLAATLSASPYTVAAGNLNGDNNLDLVITLDGGGFVVLFGNGNGTFQTPLAFAEPTNSLFVAVGSLIKGGPPGIVVADAGKLYLYFGNGAGKFYGPYIKETAANGGAIAIGDVNGQIGLAVAVEVGLHATACPARDVRRGLYLHSAARKHVRRR